MSATSGIRLLVCGGRDFRDRWAIYNRLDMIRADRGISCIISGAASGADHIAANWAKDRGVDLREFPADWSKFGKAAGPMRNRQMLNDGHGNASPPKSGNWLWRWGVYHDRTDHWRGSADRGVCHRPQNGDW